MKFDECYPEPDVPKSHPYYRQWIHEKNVWQNAQEAMRELAAEEMELAFDECDTLNLLHGAARIRALPVE